MFKTYVKIALRNLHKDKLYTLINISGLSLGIACCIVLGFYLRSEFTYDRHHEKHDRIFRIVLENNTNGVVYTSGLTPRALGVLLRRDYPEIEAVIRFQILAALNMPGSGHPFYHGKDAFYWKDVFLTDPNIFDVFTHNIIYGDPKNALSDATSIAVSERFAKTYFGNANPIGETVTTDTSQFKIKLVFADCPENSHLRYDVLISSRIFPTGDDLSHLPGDLWLTRTPATAFTYVLMPETHKAKYFNYIFDDINKRHMSEMGKQINSTMKYWVQPLADIHLESDLENDRPTGNKVYVYGFLAVGIFFFVIACINYANLTTARSIKRMREIGMRRILGEGRSWLIFQFFLESIIFAFIALIIGVVLVKAVFMMTGISGLIGKHHMMDYLQDPVIWVWMLVLSIMTGLLSGVYPAIYLLSFKTASALVIVKKSGKKSQGLKLVLVALQFIITIGVIACTLLMTLQMRYVAQKPLGFNKDDKIMIRIRGADLIEKVPAMKLELLKHNRIYDVGLTYTVPGQRPISQQIEIENNDGVMEQQTVSRMLVYNEYLEMMDIQLESGRYFSEKIKTDISESVIVNKTLVKKMGWEKPLGKQIAGRRIIGVTEDFHHQSLHQKVQPLVIEPFWDDFSNYIEFQRPMESRTMILHVAEEDLPQTLNYIKDIFLKFDPQRPFEYEFLDETLERMYLSETRLMKLVTLFSGICIFIACLGLFGLSAFATEQRTKEIGIHRVLGATTFQIIFMLSRGILILIFFAAVVASIAAYFIIDEWLVGFAYKTAINPLVFLLSAVAVLLTAFLTMTFQSYRTASDNPVNALRYE